MGIYMEVIRICRDAHCFRWIQQWVLSLFWPSDLLIVLHSFMISGCQGFRWRLKPAWDLSNAQWTYDGLQGCCDSWCVFVSWFVEVTTLNSAGTVAFVLVLVQILSDVLEKFMRMILKFRYGTSLGLSPWLIRGEMLSKSNRIQEIDIYQDMTTKSMSPKCFDTV